MCLIMVSSAFLHSMSWVGRKPTSRLWDCQNSINQIRIYQVGFLVKHEANEVYDPEVHLEVYNQ